jgi:hypothetical protein
MQITVVRCEEAVKRNPGRSLQVVNYKSPVQYQLGTRLVVVTLLVNPGLLAVSGNTLVLFIM